MTITRGVTVKSAKTRFPGMLEGLPYFRRITVSRLRLCAIGTELVAEIHVKIQSRVTHLAVAAQRRHVNFPVEPVGGCKAIGVSRLLLAHVIRLQRDDVGPFAPMADRAKEPQMIVGLVKS